MWICSFVILKKSLFLYGFHLKLTIKSHNQKFAMKSIWQIKFDLTESCHKRSFWLIRLNIAACIPIYKTTIKNHEFFLSIWFSDLICNQTDLNLIDWPLINHINKTVDIDWNPQIEMRDKFLIFFCCFCWIFKIN